MLKYIEGDDATRGARQDRKRPEISSNDSQSRHSVFRDPEHRLGEVNRNRTCAMGDQISGQMRWATSKIEHRPALRASLHQDIEDAAVKLELREIVAERRGVVVGDRHVLRPRTIPGSKPPFDTRTECPLPLLRRAPNRSSYGAANQSVETAIWL